MCDQSSSEVAILTTEQASPTRKALPRRSGTGPRNVRVRQDADTGVQVVTHPDLTIRYFYLRSLDSQKPNGVGQDHIALRHDQRHAAFALCDGVGQSYQGGVAARELGNRLVDWFWDQAPELAGDEVKLRESLRQYLDRLTTPISKALLAHQQETDLPQAHASTVGLLREAMEEVRAAGSETTFSAGYLALPGRRFPKGLLVLVWLGDSPIHVWGGNGNQRELLGDRFVEGKHWSSRHGLSGLVPNVYLGTLDDVFRVAVHSDGLDAARLGLDRTVDGAALGTYVDQAQAAGPVDDVSFIELILPPKASSSTARS